MENLDDHSRQDDDHVALPLENYFSTQTLPTTEGGGDDTASSNPELHPASVERIRTRNLSKQTLSN